MSTYGNVLHNVYQNFGVDEPHAGMGATYLAWSDRYAYTVTNVLRYKSGAKAGQVKAVQATRDIATRIDTNGMSDSQDYTYETNPNAQVETYTLRSNGRFIREGQTSGVLAIGNRNEYYDFSF
jgi:hypothetical protein